MFFLRISRLATAAQSILPPVYFSSQPSLFPLWPQWRPEWAIALISTTAVLLFVPKFLCVLLIWKKGESRLFGGFIPLCVSIFCEIVASSFLAPVRMGFHSKFVVQTLLGRQIKWGAQQRTDNQTGWLEAARVHGGATVFALLWIGAMWRLNSSFVWWLLPVAVPLALSIPLSVYSSRISLGHRLRQWRLLLIPEEINPPEIVRNLEANLNRRRRPNNELFGFDRAARDPFAYTVHIGLLRGKAPKAVKTTIQNRALLKKALEEGSAGLTRADKARLLRDATAMACLNREIGQT